MTFIGSLLSPSSYEVAPYGGLQNEPALQVLLLDFFKAFFAIFEQIIQDTDEDAGPLRFRRKRNSITCDISS